MKGKNDIEIIEVEGTREAKVKKWEIVDHVQYVYIGNCVALSSEYVRATVEKEGEAMLWKVSSAS